MKLEPGQRLWLRNRKGREGLRWLIRMTATTYEVATWQPPKPNGHQDLAAERWERGDVDDRCVILAVCRGWVAASDPAHRLPDGRPGRINGLWRALFDGQPELQAGVLEHLEETTSAFNRRINDWLEQGAAERSDMEDPYSRSRAGSSWRSSCPGARKRPATSPDGLASRRPIRRPA